MLLPDKELIETGVKCLCPKCRQASIFPSALSFDVVDHCPQCRLKLSDNDSGDGPVVFILFILCFALVPLALVFEIWLAPPLWAHAVIWGATAIFLTLGTLKPLRAYIIALEYKHRPWDKKG